MTTVEYIVRDMTGTKQHGNFVEGTPSTIDAAHSKDISLNLSPSDVESYARHGQDLHITLADGQSLILDGYYDTGATGGKNLFLSQDGSFTEVVLEDRASGMLFASYEPLDLTGKWSAYDDMVFLDIDRIEPVVAPLVAAPFLSGIGAAGAAGAAVIGGAAVLSGGGDGGGSDTTAPTVDITSGTQATGDIVNAAAHSGNPVIAGTGEPGATVTLEINDTSHTTTVADDGSWLIAFDSSEILTGEYETNIAITTTDAAGNSTTSSDVLVVDTVAPPIAVDTVETDDIINAAEASDGVVLSGVGEAGASIEVTFQGETQTTTVADDGSWSVSYAASTIAAGTYDSTVSVTSIDAAGNSSTTTHSVTVDTETSVTLDTALAGDGVINSVEQSAGVTLTGTAEAGATVVVTLASVSHTVIADTNGNWSSDFSSSEIASGTYNAAISAVSTDLAGNTATTTGTVAIDTSTFASIDGGRAGGDDIVSLAESQAGLTLTGNAEPGAAVVVTVAGVSRTATVDSSGNWSAQFEAGSIADGQYDTSVSVTATDIAGNTHTTSETLSIDTVGPPISFNTVETDDIINAAEAADGVVLSGVGEAGTSIEVTFQGETQTTTVASDGSWTVNYAASTIAAGTYDSTVSVTSVDAVGNSSTNTHSVRVDTETAVTLDSALAGDSIINGAEHSAGVTLTGTAEAGATVVVTLGSASHSVIADSSGNWSSGFSSSEITSGTYNASISAVSTDLAGNTATTTGTVAIDTSTFASIDGARAGGDNIVSMAEAQAGVTLTGIAEPGAAVVVTVAGVSRTATVDSSGNWSAQFEAGSIAEGEYDTTVSVTATDIAGNSYTTSEALSVDTFVENPGVDSVTFASGDVPRIGTEGFTDSYTVNTLETNGSVSTPDSSQTVNPVFGTEFTFIAPIPDGAHLVVSREDAAGNSSSTLLVLEDNATEVGSTDHAGVSQFNIDALNLDYAADVNLTLTEADINALSNNSDTVTIHGGGDDTVSVTGATDTGTTQTIDGQIYDVYTIGTDGTTLVIEDDINVII